MSVNDTPRVRLRDLVVPAQTWQGAPECDVHCYDMAAFPHGEPRQCRGRDLAADVRPVAPDDLLLSRPTHAPLRAWVVGQPQGRPQVASSEWLVLRGDGFDAAYARHMLVSDAFQRQLRWGGFSHGRKRPRSTVEVPDISFPLPPVEVQRHAVRLLDHTDALRSKRALVLRDVRQFGRSIFVQSFGPQPEAVFPGVMLVGLLAQPPVRGTDAPLAVRGSFPVLRPADIRGGRLSVSEAQYVSHSDAEIARAVIEDGDVIVACDPGRRDVRCAVARPGPSVWFAHSRVWRLRPDPAQLCPEFLHAWMLTAVGRRSVLAAWTADRRLPVEQRLEAIVLPLPPIELQRVYAEAVNGADRLEGRVLASAEGLDRLLGALRDLAFRGALHGA